ncbi:MAG: bifunctional hydroxymethylpyrimidine kinase/phosphomethylpyrimidine kinase [Rhodothalassiaceae bacterium]
MSAPARVLIIAGSDPGGGAGLQADLKTVTMLGGFAMAAVTALTVQDTRRVHSVEAVAADLIAEQIRVVLADLGADAVKLGLVPTAAAAQAIARALDGFSGPVVLDPVLTATSGDELSAAGEALVRHLFPIATLVTPNMPEARQLLQRPLGDPAADLAELARQGPRAVLLKGGHGTGATLVDQLRDADGRMHRFVDPRIDTRHTHGTGCTLASAIATGLAQGLDLVAAVARARSFVRAAILAAPGFGAGHGPLGHGQVRL